MKTDRPKRVDLACLFQINITLCIVLFANRIRGRVVKGVGHLDHV